MNKLLVAFDGSQQSKRAFEMGLDLAAKYKAGLVVISVAVTPEPPVAVEMEAVLESATEYYEAHFKQMKEQAGALGIEAKFEVKIGHPAEQIVHVADEERADAIVMGHRGESFFQKWLLGSVAKRVITYAHCTVIVVR
jgi:nucleotide-binding universal stress UspA family protein